MKIYIIRHGQTNANLKGLCQGITDNPLNSLGKKQAKNAADLLISNNSTNFDLFVASPLSRALETANIIREQIKYKFPLILNHNLVERDFGEFDGNPVKNYFEYINAPIKQQTKYDLSYFETDEQLQRRIVKGIKEISSILSDHSTKKVLIACHSHIIKSLFILTDPTKYNYNMICENGGIYIFDYNVDKNTFAHIQTII